LEQTVIERIREEFFTADYIREQVARAYALLAQSGHTHERQAHEATEPRARKALENIDVPTAV
jgi:hypothetical protein